MWKDNFSCLTGAISTASVAFVALKDDSVDDEEFEFSQLAFWHQGKWGNNGQTDFVVVSITFCEHPIRQVIAISPAGDAFLTGSGNVHQEQIRAGNDSPEDRGPLRAVRGIGGKAFAVGMHRQVYRRDGHNLWTCIDQDMRPRGDETVGFESVDGFGEQEIYAVGWDGEIWQFNGKGWHQIESPTNFILTDVCCAGDGNVYACGRLGMLLAGRNDAWSVIDHDSMAEDIWSLAWFKGFLYAATYRGIFRLEDGRLEPVDMGEDTPSTYYRLTNNDSLLLSMGAKDVMSFDGESWTRLE